MPSTIDVPTLYQQLKNRRGKLQQNLTRLARGQYTFVKYEATSTEDDLPQAVISSSVTVRRTSFRFNVWEDFREFDGIAFLYGFTYSLEMQDPELGALFRYECHPDVDDPRSIEEEEPEKESETRNPYSSIPHFHPNKALSHPISKLHYPFQRSERAGVVFSIIAWIETDLVKRFYDSGRVNAA